MAQGWREAALPFRNLAGRLDGCVPLNELGTLQINLPADALGAIVAGVFCDELQPVFRWTAHFVLFLPLSAPVVLHLWMVIRLRPWGVSFRCEPRRQGVQDGCELQ